MATLTLDTAVQYVKGVGPARAEQLGELGIATVEDLLMYFPRRFDLRRQCQPIRTLRGTEEAATVAGEVIDTGMVMRGTPCFSATLRDETSMVLVKWFHGGYLQGRIRPGMHIAVSGKVSVFRESPQFINPRWQIIWDPAGTTLSEDELLPVYPASMKLSSGVIGSVIQKVLPETKGLIPEWFPRPYLEARGLMERPAAVAAMHRPDHKDQWGSARRRMAYDECLLMQLGIAITRMKQVSRPAHPLVGSEEIDQRIRARFPFALTGAQDRAVAEIAADLARQRPMNRLLQGDVGSGKTVVALYAALLAVARGKQAAIMAPTEILAQQHFRKIRQYLSGSKVRTELLVGGQKETERARLLDGLAQGTISIIVGTHALLGESVQFRDLALVVVDEQHKFGVRQRSGIRGKGFAPHYLVMTATPIPRTLAMTVFGDLDVSTIDELPPGRGKTQTRVVTPAQMPQVFDLMRTVFAHGQQAYFIYPLVNASPDLELTAAEEAYRELARGPLKGFTVGLIHGQMPAAKKEQVMADFREGRVSALAASVVVEVGLDVPTANAMVVMHADRFGLAQLHQLRGRIGRGKDDAVCILVADAKDGVSRERLSVLEGTGDGFKIAEEDLRLRGPGEFFGTKQHGLPELKTVNLAEDFELLRAARRDAFAIIQEDPGLHLPHHQQLRRELIRAYSGRLDLAAG